ncbi:MAG: DNA-binding protein [Candidatus Wildermuthbacteria bacterium]|nr:DNA-binding protein [Candidatus Wildermuthbacteria bacterium]
MKLILNDKNKYILAVSKGEEIREQLKLLCETRKIEAAYFSMIGAVNDLELWWYDILKKRYKKKTFAEQLEIVSMMGNVGVLKEEIVIHTHGTFSDKNYKVYGGHVNYGVVSGACEVVLEKIDGKIIREYDEEAGLNLMCQTVV